MKLKFTLLGMSLFLLFNSALLAQVPNSIVVTSPAEIAGSYAISVPDWGGPVNIGELGLAQFSNDGTPIITDACQDAVEDLGRNWGLADRGECEFSMKALNIQNGNGALAIICNNADGAALGEGPPQMAAGTVADQVTIPVIGLSFQDCQTIRASGDDIVFEARLDLECRPLDFGPEYIWGTNPGEGDFDGGLGEWTIENQDPTGAGWLFSQDPGLDGGGTNCNGFISFPSLDLVQTGPGCGGLDLTFANITGACYGSLISPNITIDDPAGVENLVVELSHLTNYFFDGFTNLVVSFDDGVTWPDTFNVTVAADLGAILTSPFYPEADPGCQLFTETNQITNFQTKRVPVSTYAGQENIRLQFLHAGYFLDATIDDVALLSVPDDYHDIELGQEFVSYAPAFEVPLSQAQDVALHADLRNVGISSVNAELTATATDASLTEVFNVTNDEYGLQPGGCFRNQNISFPDFYRPESLGQHSVLIQNSTPNDARVTPFDAVGFNFFMTENTWSSTPFPRRFIASQELISLFSNFNRDAIVPVPEYAVAYPFFIPNGGGHTLSTVRFGVIPRPENNGNIFAYVVRWTPGDISFPDGPTGAAPGEPANPGNYAFHPDESEVVGIVGGVFGFDNATFVPIDPTLDDADGNPINYEDITMTMVAADDGTGSPLSDNVTGDFLPLELEDNTHYLLVLAIVPNDAAPIDIAAEFTDAGDGIFHGASSFAYANAGRVNRTTGHVMSLTNGFSFPEVRDIVWSGASEWGPRTPWIEMNIQPFESSTEEISEEVAQGVSIFPNPVSDRLTINLDLPEVSPTVQFELTNINGELINTDSYNDVQKGVFYMDVSDLISGIYTLNVRSEAGFAAKKVIIQK